MGAVGGRAISRRGDEEVKARRVGRPNLLENLQLKQMYGVLEAMEERKKSSPFDIR